MENENSITFNLIASAFEDTINTLYEHCNFLSQNICIAIEELLQESKQLSYFFSNEFPSTIDLLMKQNQVLMSELLNSISIHSSYVDFPETLIPSEFQYEDISDNLESVNNQKMDNPYRIQKLSLSDALNIINIVVVILMTMLAPFYNHVVDSSISDQEIIGTDSSITEEQAQQILEYLSELTEHQKSITAAIEASGELAPMNDSDFDDTQHHFATPDSASFVSD